jgi:serine/threonine protein kinase
MEQKVAHRDLKCENVLLDRYNNIRVIDFGLSNQFTDIHPRLSTACGSPAYASPEMVRGNTYTQVADIWSAGILLYGIVAGFLPFDDDDLQILLQKIVYTETHFPAFMTPQLIDLLQKMLCKDPERRITLAMIKCHPWFSQTEYLALLDEMHQGAKWDGQDPEAAIHKEIIDEMTALGIDCRELHHSLLVGDFTELTALYRIILREQTVEKMKGIMLRVNQVSALRKLPMPIGRQATTSSRQVPAARPANPLPVGVVCQRVLTTPIAANPYSRRGSRPVAVRPTVVITVPRITGHEA